MARSRKPFVEANVDAVAIGTLHPITRVSVKEAVIEQLCNYISDHSLELGARLPTEQELSTILNVGRSSIREAVSGLMAYGILVRRPGDGTYITSSVSNLVVRPLRFRIALDPDSMREILEARKAIEAECAYLAAERALPEDIGEIEKHLQKMTVKTSRIDEVSNADFNFHMAIAKAAGNAVLFDVLNYLSDLVFRSHTTITRMHGGLTEETHTFHAGILDAIKRRNPKRARSLMAQHLESVIKRFEGRDGR